MGAIVSGDRAFAMTGDRQALNAVGLGFIDILFGLAASQVFIAVQQTPSPHRISVAGWGYLVVALFVIVLSYIGYHTNRVHRGGGWPLDFRSLPMIELGIDVLLVGTYFLLVIESPGIPTGATDHGRPAAAVMQATLLAVIFLLYFVWDATEHIITGTQRYGDFLSGGTSDLASLHGRTAKHRARSLIFFGIFAGLAVVVWIWRPTDTGSLVGLDAVYIMLLLLYRGVLNALRTQVRPAR